MPSFWEQYRSASISILLKKLLYLGDKYPLTSSPIFRDVAFIPYGVYNLAWGILSLDRPY